MCTDDHNLSVLHWGCLTSGVIHGPCADPTVKSGPGLHLQVVFLCHSEAKLQKEARVDHGSSHTHSHARTHKHTNTHTLLREQWQKHCSLRAPLKDTSSKAMHHRGLTAMPMEVHQSYVRKGRAKSGRTVISIPEIASLALHYRTNLISQTTRKRNRQIPWLPKMRKQTSRLRSCTLCIRGLA